jgi:hypothetical protein
MPAVGSALRLLAALGVIAVLAEHFGQARGDHLIGVEADT